MDNGRVEDNLADFPYFRGVKNEEGMWLQVLMARPRRCSTGERIRNGRAIHLPAVLILQRRFTP